MVAQIVTDPESRPGMPAALIIEGLHPPTAPVDSAGAAFVEVPASRPAIALVKPEVTAASITTDGLTFPAEPENSPEAGALPISDWFEDISDEADTTPQALAAFAETTEGMITVDFASPGQEPLAVPQSWMLDATGVGEPELTADEAVLLPVQWLLTGEESELTTVNREIAVGDSTANRTATMASEHLSPQTPAELHSTLVRRAEILQSMAEPIGELEPPLPQPYSPGASGSEQASGQVLPELVAALESLQTPAQIELAQTMLVAISETINYLDDTLAQAEKTGVITRARTDVLSADTLAIVDQLEMRCLILLRQLGLPFDALHVQRLAAAYVPITIRAQLYDTHVLLQPTPDTRYGDYDRHLYTPFQQQLSTVANPPSIPDQPNSGMGAYLLRLTLLLG